MKRVLNERDYNKVITETPNIISILYYEVLETRGGKVPRKDSVIKRYKEIVEKTLGVSFKKLSDYEKHTLLKTAEDCYYGIREAELG